MQLRCTALPLPRARRSLRDPRKERWSLKLTRHNGRAGKHGTYNPKHNDRSFEIANSEHIDPERVQQNIYWDCYNGIRSALQPKSEESLADTFEEVEKLYYKLHYTNFTEKQNERNAKIRHTERNRSTEDLLTSKKTCPEESIYQLGTLESHASPKELFQIATEFMDEFHERFGKHVHILDWALHLDEGTPHIHERHVFDCENKYGEIAPQQEKALEALGFELPKPDKPLGRYNNRKITFDAACRTMLFEIAKRHGLELDEVPEYGGRAYLEKQDYIMAKQKLDEVELTDRCTVSEFTKQINELCEETNRKKLTAKFVNELLLDKGYLKETAEQGEEKHKRVTEKGRLAGILEEERHAKYGKSYYALIHTRESQSMILTELKEYFASQGELAD